MAGLEEDTEKRARAARYLVRISAVTRAIGIIACMGAVFTVFAALGMRSSSDQVGFTLIGLAVLLFGILVWATGVFHGAVGAALPTLFAMNHKLDTLGRLLAEGDATHESAPPGAAVEAPPAPAAALEPAPAAALEPAPAPTPEPAPEPAPQPAPEAKAAVRRIEPAPEIERKPCPHCGGLIHPDARRCVHCMRKVA